jgi:hypothetical protein
VSLWSPSAEGRGSHGSHLSPRLRVATRSLPFSFFFFFFFFFFKSKLALHLLVSSQNKQVKTQVDATYSKHFLKCGPHQKKKKRPLFTFILHQNTFSIQKKEEKTLFKSIIKHTYTFSCGVVIRMSFFGMCCGAKVPLREYFLISCLLLLIKERGWILTWVGLEECCIVITLFG